MKEQVTWRLQNREKSSAAGASPQTPLEDLTALPQILLLLHCFIRLLQLGLFLQGRSRFSFMYDVFCLQQRVRMCTV